MMFLAQDVFSAYAIISSSMMAVLTSLHINAYSYNQKQKCTVASRSLHAHPCRNRNSFFEMTKCDQNKSLVTMILLCVGGSQMIEQLHHRAHDHSRLLCAAQQFFWPQFKSSFFLLKRIRKTSHLGIVWMMKMSCPRTDSFTSTLVSAHKWDQGGLERTKTMAEHGRERPRSSFVTLPAFPSWYTTDLPNSTPRRLGRKKKKKYGRVNITTKI